MYCSTVLQSSKYTALVHSRHNFQNCTYFISSAEEAWMLMWVYNICLQDSSPLYTVLCFNFFLVHKWKTVCCTVYMQCTWCTHFEIRESSVHIILHIYIFHKFNIETRRRQRFSNVVLDLTEFVLIFIDKIVFKALKKYYKEYFVVNSFLYVSMEFLFLYFYGNIKAYRSENKAKNSRPFSLTHIGLKHTEGWYQ